MAERFEDDAVQEQEDRASENAREIDEGRRERLRTASVVRDEFVGPKAKCPGCEVVLSANDLRAQIAHMEANHPEIIARRLAGDRS